MSSNKLNFQLNLKLESSTPRPFQLPNGGYFTQHVSLIPLAGSHRMPPQEMLSPVKFRRSLCLVFIPFLIISSIVIVQSGLYHKIPKSLVPSSSTKAETPIPIRKPLADPPTPIVDNFPLAANAKSTTDLPPVPSWNAPPTIHVAESTPLFIGFTRNWRLLQQTVVSYITAGWPPADIYVIENTGVMDSNRDGLLTLQNPFYVDHYRLTKILGINVISTPTLFTFAQLQNFYIYTALANNWTHYFWAHMDTVVVSDEEREPFEPLYTRAVSALRETLEPNWGPLATLWFAYDRLALVRTQAFVDVGGWDTMIPFYMTDCDMHERLWMRDFRIENAEAGKVWDVASSLEDLEVLYRKGDNVDSNAQRNSPAYKDLVQKLDDMQHAKATDSGGRNTWQARQRGGQGEPFYRDAEGFERAVMMWMEFGRDVFTEKWGRGPCDIRDAGMIEGDAWRVEKDWEKPEVQWKYAKAKEESAKVREAEMKEKEMGKPQEKPVV